MKRVSIRMPDRMLDDLQQLVDEGYHVDRSEAIRDIVRDELTEHFDTVEPRPRADPTIVDWGESD